MSLIDMKALETNFDGWRKERVPSLSISKAFERFAIEQILKDADLTDEELASGILGGDDDGGVDGMYFFVNRLLIQEEIDLPDPALSGRFKIHFDIEDKLKRYDLFYDRRKGEYRELRKPVQKIISIRTLARAVIAIVLRRPDDARARPQSLLNDDKTYSEIFNDAHNRDLYVVCILIDRKVDAYLTSCDDIKPDAKTDVKYYVDMWLICDLLKNATPTARDIAALLPDVGENLLAQLTESSDSVMEIYTKLGATDKVAKGTEMRRSVSEALTAKFPPVAPLAKATGKS